MQEAIVEFVREALFGDMAPKKDPQEISGLLNQPWDDLEDVMKNEVPRSVVSQTVMRVGGLGAG